LVKEPSRFRTLDVFTRGKFGGKPLILFEDADGLGQADLVDLAREFNLPAAFLIAPRDPVNSARLRVFTPDGEELGFSAQALIGAAISLARSRAAEILARREVVVVLEIAGEIFSCEVIKSKSGVCYAQFALNRAARPGGSPPDVETLAAALALAPDEIGFKTHAPRVQGAVTPFVLVPVGSRAALDRARPSPASLERVLNSAAGLCLYTNETIAPDSAIRARVFGPGAVEDPASGEAAAAFAGAACAFERPSDGEHQIFIEQGHKSGRASRLTLGLSIEGGALANIHLGGQAVEVSRGELTP
jgi:trans-2,3-dihydro-3-hydroxyanthranilate isomerase